MPAMYCLRKVFKLGASFRFAFGGIVGCLCRERNFRIHVVAVCYTWVLSALLKLDRVECMILLLTQALVLSLELVNTAVEAAADLASPQRCVLAKLAKDSAAGAVLIAAGASVAVGCFLFWRPALQEVVLSILTVPWSLLGLLVSVGLSVWFIFGFKEKE